jgi:hypothetical protein
MASKSMKTILALVLFGMVTAVASPPFRYDSARAWAEKTVQTDIPESKRIYLFGPERVAEAYSLDGKPAAREVDMRHILSADSVRTVHDIWRQVPLDLKGTWMLSVYRASAQIEPVYRLSKADVFVSTFPLQPGDVVWIRPLPAEREP